MFHKLQAYTAEKRGMCQRVVNYYILYLSLDFMIVIYCRFFRLMFEI